MEIRTYTNEAQSVQKFAALVREIYSGVPYHADAVISQFLRHIDASSPSTEFSQFQNFLLCDGDKPLAHAIAIIDRRLSGVGLVGYFECLNNENYAKKILDEVKKFFVSRNIHTIRGPVNFSTWSTFRFGLSEQKPPFFTEPFSREYYAELFHSFGFEPVQYNITQLSALPESNSEDLKKAENDGFQFEFLSKDNFNEILGDIYPVASASFSDTWSFVPISRDEFFYLYRGFEPRAADCIVVSVRNREGKPVGFCFAVPDLYHPADNSLVAKSMGVLPEYQGHGIAKALFALVYKTAKERGFTKIYYSTMRVDNDAIKKITAAGGEKENEPFRRYAVYEMQI